MIHLAGLKSEGLKNQRRDTRTDFRFAQPD